MHACVCVYWVFVCVRGCAECIHLLSYSHYRARHLLLQRSETCSLLGKRWLAGQHVHTTAHTHKDIFVLPNISVSLSLLNTYHQSTCIHFKHSLHMLRTNSPQHWFIHKNKQLWSLFFSVIFSIIISLWFSLTFWAHCRLVKGGGS